MGTGISRALVLAVEVLTLGGIAILAVFLLRKLLGPSTREDRK